MTSPLVSVVVPTHNYGSYLGRAIESVWTQTYDHIEIVIVDDGSTDETPHVIDFLAAHSPVPLTVIRQENAGVCAAMNAGIRAASGKYISVLHADDVYVPHKVAAQVEAIESADGIVLVHSEYVCIDESDRLIPGVDSSLDLPPSVGLDLEGILWLKSDVRSMTMFFPRTEFFQVGGYDEMLPNEDWQSILKLAARGKIAHVPQALVLRRIHERNRLINRTRRPEFSFAQVSPHVLREVAPPGTNVEDLLSFHCANIVKSSIASGNYAKARYGSQFAWTNFRGVRSRYFVISSVLSGMVSRLWACLSPRLSHETRRMLRRAARRLRC